MQVLRKINGLRSKTLTELKNALAGLNTIDAAEERINELENMKIKTSTVEKHKEERPQNSPE